MKKLFKGLKTSIKQLESLIHFLIFVIIVDFSIKTSMRNFITGTVSFLLCGVYVLFVGITKISEKALNKK